VADAEQLAPPSTALLSEPGSEADAELAEAVAHTSRAAPWLGRCASSAGPVGPAPALEEVARAPSGRSGVALDLGRVGIELLLLKLRGPLHRPLDLGAHMAPGSVPRRKPREQAEVLA
jgi:hypothetical protein